MQVQRQKKRDHAGPESEPVVAAPIRKLSGQVVAAPEKKPSQEAPRPTPTLAQAAGLKESPPQHDVEPPPAPWSSVHAGIHCRKQISLDNSNVTSMRHTCLCLTRYSLIHKFTHRTRQYGQKKYVITQATSYLNP